MKTFLLRRLLFSVFAVWGVATLVFGMLQLSGDPVAVIMAGSFGTPEYIAKLRHDLGLDLPVYQQYLRFLGDALHGDLGRSLRWSQPALPLVIQRLPATFELAVAAMLFAVAVAVPAGVLSATRPRSRRSCRRRFAAAARAPGGRSCPAGRSGGRGCRRP